MTSNGKMNGSRFLSFKGVEFWLGIMGIVAMVIIWGMRLEGKVSAMTGREVANKNTFYSFMDLENNRHELLMEVRDSQIRMEVDIEQIKKALGN